MNQSKTKELHNLFSQIIVPGDPTNNRAWRALKKNYNKVPRPERQKFMEEFELHVFALKKEMKG